MFKKKIINKKLSNLFNSIIFPFTIFFIGVLGIIFNRTNIILILMSVELILLSINFSFVLSSIFLDDLLGQIFALIILTVAASESAIGLAILVICYRTKHNIFVEHSHLLRG